MNMSEDLGADKKYGNQKSEPRRPHPKAHVFALFEVSQLLLMHKNILRRQTTGASRVAKFKLHPSRHWKCTIYLIISHLVTSY